MVIAVPLVEMSAKIRTGDPIDEPEDLDGPHWGGHVPIRSCGNRRWRRTICPTGSRSRRRSRRSTAVACERRASNGRTTSDPSPRAQTRSNSTARTTSGTAIRSPPTRVIAVPIERLALRARRRGGGRILPTGRVHRRGERTPGPLRSLAEPGAVEVREVGQRQHEQDTGVGVPGPEEAFAELAERAVAFGDEAEQRPSAGLDGDERQEGDGREQRRGFHGSLRSCDVRR